MYEFQSDIRFSNGGLDELLALDRYVVSTFDPNDMGLSDKVVVITDALMDEREVAQIIQLEPNDGYVRVRTNKGREMRVRYEHVHKPLETTPQEMWTRWSKGAASVEKTEEDRVRAENRYRMLFDGYSYSPGGRIQLMLGQEFVTGRKAKLTAYNCFVLPNPKGARNPIEQWMAVLDTMMNEIDIMRRGGGVGLNLSDIETVKGAGIDRDDVHLYLPNDHKDTTELLDRVKIGKFTHVFTHVTSIDIETNRGLRKITVGDSIDALIEAMKTLVINAYKGNITYLDFSRLRPRNSIVRGVNGRSSGAASWMEMFDLISSLLQRETIDAIDFAEIFSAVVHLIQQGGSRRGALMLVLNDARRDVLEKFIVRKRTPGKLIGANISVGISDEFMSFVSIPGTDEERLWNLIVESAHASAEPGIVWLGRMNKWSNSWYFRELVATNPCGEQPLPGYGVCNLGHIVLPAYAVGERIGRYKIDWDKLERNVRSAVRFQDAVIDYTDYFLEQNAEIQLSERRIGIGTMGLGTLLILMGLRYGSDEAIEFIDELYSRIAYWAYQESIELAREKGPFARFEYDKFVQSLFVRQLLERFPDLNDGLKRYGIRNVTLLTQAPTGTSATLLDNIPGFDCSTGIEPYYSWEYWRAGRFGREKQEVELVRKYRNENGLSDDDPLPDYFITAMELTPEEHVRVQAVIQRWVDSSISKTCNAPTDYTIEQTKRLYELAYDLGCKGITIYRDGSREAQVLATSEENAKLESHIEVEMIQSLKQQQDDDHHDDNVVIMKRPQRLFGLTEKIRIPTGDGQTTKVYITVNIDEETGLPIEVFINANDHAVRSVASALGRMTTQFLRFGGTRNNVEQAVKHLKKSETFGSLPYQLAILLEQIAYGKIEFTAGRRRRGTVRWLKCSSCGEEAYDKVNCVCHACGQSKCN